jgi:hypothetical protein
VPASDDSEDDCGEQMECRLARETEVLGENLPQRHTTGLALVSAAEIPKTEWEIEPITITFSVSCTGVSLLHYSQYLKH